MERSLTQYERGVNLGFAIFRRGEDNFPFSTHAGNTRERGEETRDEIFRKGFLCVFDCVKVILGGRIALAVDRPTSKAVHRCTCGFRVD